MTVKFWYVYAEEIVANYLHMSRAVRTNDFSYYLGENDINFFLQHYRLNCARHIMLYFLRLLNIESTHPGLKQQLQNGVFSIKLSENSFARQTIDMAVEVGCRCSKTNNWN